MSSMAQIWQVDLARVLILMEEAKQDMVEAVVKVLGERFRWNERARAEAQFLRVAAQAVLLDGKEAAPDCGWIYAALAFMADAELLNDGWRKDYSVALAPWAARQGLGEPARTLLEDMAGGRTPRGLSVGRSDDDVVACFLRPEEAQLLVEGLLALPEEGGGGNIAEEILYNELLPTLDRPAPPAEDRGFVLLTL